MLKPGEVQLFQRRLPTRDALTCPHEDILVMYGRTGAWAGLYCYACGCDWMMSDISKALAMYEQARSRARE